MSKTRKIRRARAAVARAEKSAQAAISAAESAKQRVADIEAATADIRYKWDYVCRVITSTLQSADLLSAAANGVQQVVDHRQGRDPYHPHRMHVMNSISDLRSMSLNQAVQTVDLHGLVLEYRQSIELHPQYIIDLQFGSGRSRFAMTESALQNVPVEYLAEKIARELIIHLKSSGAR